MWPSTIIIGSRYIVKIAGLAYCFRIASTTARDGPSYFCGLWLQGGIANPVLPDVAPSVVAGAVAVIRQSPESSRSPPELHILRPARIRRRSRLSPDDGS